MAPCEMSSALTICTRPVRKAAAVAFSASFGIVPIRESWCCGYPCAITGASSRPSGSATQITNPDALRSAAARSSAAGRARVSKTRARSLHNAAMPARSTPGLEGFAALASAPARAGIGAPVPPA